jgi:soluble lytic murein transglycosylase-like protein
MIIEDFDWRGIMYYRAISVAALSILFIYPANATSTTITDIVNKYATKNKVDPLIVRAIIAVESAGNPDAVNPEGSHGLMQVQLATARVMKFTGTAKELRNPDTNIKYGTLYFRMMLDQFGDLWVALDAYNRGPGNVQKWPYKGNWERHPYVSKVMMKLGGSYIRQISKN